MTILSLLNYIKAQVIQLTEWNDVATGKKPEQIRSFSEDFMWAKPHFSYTKYGDLEMVLSLSEDKKAKIRIADAAATEGELDDEYAYEWVNIDAVLFEGERAYISILSEFALEDLPKKLRCLKEAFLKFKDDEYTLVDRRMYHLWTNTYLFIEIDGDEDEGFLRTK
ncbi:hypothetical protein CR970_03375 [Candidatus Saccharibacteria bacterium]|nr:MAG: hypothetical protein CR970_03375 [Candidatus Saccharibacteria bacterium]